MAINFPKEKWRQAVTRLTEAGVDIASLSAFRILFGLLMAAAMVRFISKGWVRQLYVEPSFHFSYPGFAWVQPWPSFWMHAHFVALAALALGVACGFFYRTCITLFFLGFTYVELIDQTAYLNHYYFISLISGLMIFLPANRAWSIDALRKPEIRLETAPAWTLNLLRFQVAVVYFFAGLAKINADWLLHAQPLRIWLPARSDLMFFGPWLNEVWIAYAASWFGAIFDLSIVFFLLNKRTRRPAYAFVVLFHVATWLLFNIGMFPWIMIVSATLLFADDWPRVWLARFRSLASRRFKPSWLANRQKPKPCNEKNIRDPLSRGERSPNHALDESLDGELISSAGDFLAGHEPASGARTFLSASPTPVTRGADRNVRAPIHGQLAGAPVCDRLLTPANPKAVRKPALRFMPRECDLFHSIASNKNRAGIEPPTHAFIRPLCEGGEFSWHRQPHFRGMLTLWLVGLYVIVQLALPLRSYFFSEPPAWTGAGFNCAWRVMLVEKSGYAEFRAFDPATGLRWKLPAREYLTRRQEMMMAQDPYLVRAMARRMAADLRECGYPHIRIQADSFATLNGRPSQRLINPEFNLAGAGHAWVPLSF